MLDQELDRTAPSGAPEPDLPGFGDDEPGEEEVPTVVLYVIAGLLLLSFTLFLIVGGGHSHFH